MIANGSFNFITLGNVVNSGKLDLRAKKLLNAASGEINADW